MYKVGELKDESLAKLISSDLYKKNIPNELIRDSATGVISIFVLSKDNLDQAFDLYRVLLGIPKPFEMPKEWEKIKSLSGGRATYTIIAICLVIFVLSSFSQTKDYLEFLFFSNEQNELFLEIKNGQLWRALTPMLLHFSMLHLFFNMMWLKDLGRIIEHSRGITFFILFTVVIGVLANVGQYLVQGPMFGGMSGVVYGFLGYLWMNKTFNPDTEFSLPKNDVVMMIAWFFLCALGLIGNIANTAHALGLYGGMLVGIFFGEREEKGLRGLYDAKVIKYSLLAHLFVIVTLIMDFYHLKGKFYFLIFESINK